MAIKAINIWKFGGGSVVRGTVDTQAVADATHTPRTEIDTAVTRLKSKGVSAAYQGFSGRTGADATGNADSDIRAALLAAYGPGPRGGAINISAAAKGEGKSASTIKRWIANKAAPKPANRAQLLANARKAADSLAGRAAALTARRTSASGAKIAKYGARLIVTGIQGRETYERDRTVAWNLDPELAEMAFTAYEEKGDEGLADFMADYANTDAYGNLDDWNVFNFDKVAFDEKSRYEKP